MLYNNTMKGNKGYTLLFAVLIASVALGIGISILNISKKELLISTSARDSSSAFYAADSGIECAIYADLWGSFDTAPTNTNPTLYCNVPHSFTTISPNTPDATQGTFVFHMKSGSAEAYDPANPNSALKLAGQSCVVVTVEKLIDGTGKVRTTIKSRGYNTGWRPTGDGVGVCDLTSAKRVERGLSYASY